MRVEQLMTALSFVGLLLLANPVWSQNQEESEATAEAAERESTSADAVTSLEKRALRPGRYMGAASCASSNCHGSTDALAETNVLQNEYFTWLNADPHAEAFSVLYDDESALILRNMRLSGNAWQEKLCLDCHTMNVPRSLQENPIELEEGVSCEVCHGPASGWIAEHTEPGFAHADSVKRGLVDQWSVVKRTEVCLACHLGNEHKSVDHELIAAGHPELRFELDNFTGALPQHWLNYGETQRQQGRRDSHGIRAWAVGQVVSFKESLEQLASRARGDRWPEFAEMSCDACHHDLENSQWRQIRGYKYRAGLPGWSPARWAVLRLLIEQMAPESAPQLEARVEDLARSVAHMNRPDETARAADELVGMLGGVLQTIDRARFSKADAQAFLSSLSQYGEYLETTDIQTAEQVFLTVNSVASYLAGLDRSILRGEIPDLLENLDTEVSNRSEFSWQRFNAYLASVANGVN